MNIQVRGQDRAEYLKGDTWRCSASPTGAHHWIIRNKTICKYCNTAKQPPDVQSERDTVIHPAVT